MLEQLFFYRKRRCICVKFGSDPGRHSTISTISISGNVELFTVKDAIDIREKVGTVTTPSPLSPDERFFSTAAVF